MPRSGTGGLGGKAQPRRRTAGALRGRGGPVAREAGASASVLIGPVRGPEHLELIRRQAFYHVPVGAIAARRAASAHIAFYEPGSRFGGPGAIRQYAAVRRVAEVRRAELPDIPWPGRRGEDARYYRFDLGPLLPLPRPITNPGRRRVVFRFTDLAALQAAGTLADLGRAGRGAPASKEET